MKKMTKDKADAIFALHRKHVYWHNIALNTLSKREKLHAQREMRQTSETIDKLLGYPSGKVLVRGKWVKKKR